MSNTVSSAAGGGVEVKVASAEDKAAIDARRMFERLPIALKAVAPHALPSWANVLQPAFIKWNIITPRRAAAALGQMTVESAGFTAVVENLNYSADRLMAVWPNRFNAEKARLYAHNPERIANYVYANRMGNTSEASGDGWRRRGAGLIQLTGAANQNEYAVAAKLPDDTHVWDYLKTAAGAADSACWFLVTKANLLAFADNWQLTRLSTAVNGGRTALQERIKFSNMALDALKGR